MITLLNELVEKRMNELVSLNYLNTNFIFFTKQILKEVKLCKIKNMILVEKYMTITQINSEFILSYNNNNKNEDTKYYFENSFMDLIKLIYDSKIFTYKMEIHQCENQKIFIRKIGTTDSIFKVDKYINFNSEESFFNFNKEYDKFETIFEPTLYHCLIEYLEENLKIENLKIKNLKNNI